MYSVRDTLIREPGGHVSSPRDLHEKQRVLMRGDTVFKRYLYGRERSLKTRRSSDPCEGHDGHVTLARNILVT